MQKGQFEYKQCMRTNDMLDLIRYNKIREKTKVYAWRA